MAVIDKSVTNIYNNCSSPELITAIEKLTQAVKDLKPSEETDPRYAESLQREKEIVQAIKGIYEP